jgi:hypothetical protein
VTYGVLWRVVGTSARGRRGVADVGDNVVRKVVWIGAGWRRVMGVWW